MKTNKHPKLKNHSLFIKTLSIFLCICFLNLFTGCANYFKITKPNASIDSKIPYYYLENKKMIVHNGDDAWILEIPEVSDGTIKGFAKKRYTQKSLRPIKPNRPNRFKIKSPYNQYDILNEVHIYTTELSRISEDRISFPASAVERIDVYEFDKSATNGSAVLGAIGGAALVWGGFFLILMLTSCPFIYSFDGNDYQLAGEIFSGSIQKQLERNDFIKLPLKDAKSPEYRLKITNELKEVQHTNLLELWVFDHSKNSRIAVDKYGKPYNLSEIESANSARNLTGFDVSNLVKKEDNLFYTSTELNGELQTIDGLVLEFKNPENTGGAKLLIRAKNSLVMDYMIGQFYNQFGDLYNKWTKKQKKVPAEQLRQWTLDQNLPLSLSVERNGKWEKVDYFNIAGPVAMKDDILSIPLDGTESDPLKVKLEFGNFFWEIDYVGIDYTENSEVEYQIISANSAIDQNGNDVSKKLTKEDNKYYIQSEIGDQAVVNFTLPELTNESRTIILHSKGWYQILRNPTGTPDREYLETFREPGRFNEFVNDYFQNLTDNNLK